MKEQKEKYESPFMERTLVELEDSCCVIASGQDMNKNKTKVEAENHYKGGDFTDSSGNTLDANNTTWE